MDWRKHIHSDPEILLGKPVVRGTRISVELILEALSGGESIQDLLEDYPHLTEEHIRAALAFPGLPHRPRSLGAGASGLADTARLAGDIRPEPRSWR